MTTPPYIPPDLPQMVSVTNWPAPHSYAQDYFDTIRREYDALRDMADENQIAVIRYHSPAGAVIRVVDVRLYQGTDTLIFYGDDGKNFCTVLAQPQSAQLVMKILTAEEAPERRPVGFRVVDPDRPEEAEPQSEQTQETGDPSRRQELMDLMANAGTPTQVAVARGAADTWLADHPNDGDVRAARDRLADVNPAGD